MKNSKIIALVKAGYLKKVGYRGCTGEVILPAPAALKWLKECFQPLPMRPILKIAEVAKMTGTDKGTVRSLCLTYDIPIHVNEALGELFTIVEFEKFLDRLHGSLETNRFDRGAFLHYLRVILDRKKTRLNPPAFHERVEKEIGRILRLPEPERTIRAGIFVNCYSSARSVIDCLKNYDEKARERLRSLDEMVRRFNRIVMKDSREFSEHASGASRPATSVQTF